MLMLMMLVAPSCSCSSVSGPRLLEALLPASLLSVALLLLQRLRGGAREGRGEAEVGGGGGRRSARRWYEE